MSIRDVLVLTQWTVFRAVGVAFPDTSTCHDGPEPSKKFVALFDDDTERYLEESDEFSTHEIPQEETNDDGSKVWLQTWACKDGAGPEAKPVCPSVF